ncbi:MAG: PAS domain-containing sensor histidine kinase [Synechococcales bacterium]|nr:PAS domain-containing sensor histidine kinase [Synechococcales bacterium]
MSDRILDLAGVDAEAVMQDCNQLIERLHPDDREGYFASVEAAINNEKNWHYEGRYIKPGGEVRWWQGDATLTRNIDSEMVFYGTLLDVTSQKQAEASLQLCEARWQLALSSSHEGIWDWNPTTDEVDFSSRWKAMLGYAESELENHMNTCLRLLSPEDVEPFQRLLYAHLRQETPYFRGEFQMRCKDGRYKQILSQGQAWWDGEGKPTRFVGFHRDLTEYQQAAAGLAAAKEAVAAAKQSSTQLLVAMNHELRIQNHRLEKSQQAQEEFLTTVCHDLRSPLSNISAANTLLKTVLMERGFENYRVGQAEPPKTNVDPYLYIIQQECDRELSLINNFLDIQKIEANQIFIQREWFDLNAWLLSLVETFGERAQVHQQQLEMNSSTDELTVFCCPRSLYRIISELLNNACKYTPSGERIVITVTRSEMIQIQVTNYGTEIPADALPYIFDKFYRVPRLDRWHQGGTGLGLAIVKLLVKQMQGTIRAESKHGATTFTLELPKPSFYRTST